MEIILSNSANKPIYEQITDQIKAMILRGELKETRCPLCGGWRRTCISA